MFIVMFWWYSFIFVGLCGNIFSRATVPLKSRLPTSTESFPLTVFCSCYIGRYDHFYLKLLLCAVAETENSVHAAIMARYSSTLRNVTIVLGYLVGTFIVISCPWCPTCWQPLCSQSRCSDLGVMVFVDPSV